MASTINEVIGQIPKSYLDIGLKMYGKDFDINHLNNILAKTTPVLNGTKTSSISLSDDTKRKRTISDRLRRKLKARKK